jgi:NAD(P)-dependent dehydrogenase (short-subunit alcohol dehydrogenase family)
MFSIDLAGRLAWVTGASRGIGKATALALADAGANVAITYRTREKEAHEVVSEILKRGVKALATQMDSKNLQSCEQAHRQISDNLGVVDILVNNTGIIKDDLFSMLDDEAWQEVLTTNLFGTVHATRLVIKDMMLKRQGRIINLSSAAASKGGRGQANYAASKGAIESMSRSLAVELGRRGITVNCIAPGVIETDMSREIRSLAQQEILQRQIIQRFGQPNDIAAWIVFLASDFGAYITGEVIHIDGGLKLV